MKKLLFITLFVFLLPLNVHASTCSDVQVKRFEFLAKEIQTTFDYTETSNDILFTINFHNVSDDLYLVDYNSSDTLLIYKKEESGLISVPDSKAGTTYTFSVLNENSICDSKIITDIKVTTPNYNKYYKDSLCSGIESYSYCQKWSNIGNVSYEEFKKNVENYKKQQESNNNNIDNNVPEDNNANRIRNFIANNYIYIIIGVALISTVIIALYNNKKKNDW